MAKAVYVGDSGQQTPQMSISGMSTYNVGPLMIQKNPSDTIGILATLTNTGNMDLTVTIKVTHEHEDGVFWKDGGSVANISIPISSAYNFDSGPLQLDTVNWQPGIYATRLEVLDQSTLNPIPTVGNTLIPLAWNMAVVTEVTITNFSVY